MKQIPVKDLHSCMVTALDVLNYDKKVIVPKGVILTENIITRLDGYSVYYICVNDQIINGFTHPLINAGNGKASKDSQFTRNFGRRKNFSKALSHLSIRKAMICQCFIVF